MDRYGLTFHHFGLAARQPDKAVAFLKKLGYETGQTVSDELQKVDLIFCRHPEMPAVEIISPAADGTPGPLETFLKAGPALIYHLCFESQDVAQSVAAMEADQQQVFCMSEPKPAVLFGGREVSFYRVGGFGLIELLAPAPPANRNRPPRPT